MFKRYASNTLSLTDGAYHYPLRGGVPRAFSASAFSLIVDAPAR